MLSPKLSASDCLWFDMDFVADNLRISREEAHTKLQAILFNMGYSWYVYTPNKVRKTDATHLAATSYKTIYKATEGFCNGVECYLSRDGVITPAVKSVVRSVE